MLFSGKRMAKVVPGLALQFHIYIYSISRCFYPKRLRY